MLSANGLSSVWKLGEGSAGPQLKCIRGQCFSPSGKVLAVAHGKMKEAELTVLDAATGKHLWRLTEKVGSLERPSESIVSLRYASSGDLLAVGGAGEHIPMGTVEYEAALGEDEDSIDEDPNIFVYALTGPSKDNLRMVSKHAKGMLVRSLAFSPDEKRLACGGDGVTGIVIVDPHTSGRTLMRLSQYPQVCWSCSFSPNGKEIAAGFNNDEVCAVYDLERKSMVDFFPGRGPVHFSADGMAMIYGGKTEKWVHARLLAHIAPISSLTKSVFGFIRCKSAVQKFPLEEVLKYAKHRLFAGKGPKGGGLLHIAMAGLKHKQSAFTVDDVKRIISAHPLSCLTAIGKMTDAEDGLQPSTPLLMAIDRGWQAVYNHMFEELSKFNPSEVSLPPFSHKMLRIQRQGIQITAAHLIAHFPKRIEVASLCMSLLVMDPPGILRGVPKGANEYAFTVSSLAALTDIVSTELVDEDPRDAELGLEPLTHQKAEPSIYEPQQKAAVCRPHILEKDLYSGSEWQLRVMNFPADEVQEAVMASREPALVFHPLFKSAVRWKWDTYGRRLATAETFLMILFLTIYIAWGSLLLGCPPALPLPGNEAEYDKIFLMCPSITTSDDLWKLGLVHLAMTIPMLGLTSIYVFKELQEGISIEYFHDIFNVIDFVGLFLTIGLALADIALRWIAIGTNDVLEATKQQHWAFLYLASVALLLHFIRLNEKYRAFRVFGTYVRALLQIFSDMGGFVFLLFTIVAAFSISFFWLYNAESEAPDRGNAGGMQIDFSFFRALTFGILAQYSFDDLAGFPRFLSLLIILLWFVTQVVMLNSLIALVSESWATITGQRELNCLIERGTLLQNLDSFWRKGKGMPRMLFVAERGDADMLELHRDTQREEEEHKKRVESSISALSSEVSELKKIVETLAPSPGSALSRSKTGGKGGLGPGGPGGPRGSVASFLTADDISIRERTFDIQSNLAPPDERRVTQQGNPTMKVDSTLMSPVPISADRRSPSRGPRRPEDDSPGP
uniref:Uncharacterized protein n=1 Tax=Chromera velia CCMP2878 TaxID=1169474 RepID=A0A0G4F1P3_9ALVE|eukprot:Cvel_14734.t1-p1 / transcript=Cvel_14734.t1 / gene=Cvel_14734 / organism=Chromera_velia_CCMP2878 / gene_product=hypothetical protein / transcript_product=hypothetical protein / location=Cvel_scaffold1060:6429-15029(+) / protein_length=1012 / sequence_SO=supercontig / SO=protein_coding / is_pseudo=false